MIKKSRIAQAFYKKNAAPGVQLCRFVGLRPSSARAISRAILPVNFQELSLGTRKATFPALKPELSLENSGVGKATIRLFECSKH